MKQYRQVNFNSLCGMHRIFTILLLCATIAAGGSISSTHKNSSPPPQMVVQQQQQQNHLQQHLQQQQHLSQQKQQLQQQQQQQHQQQSTELHQNLQQDSNHAHMRPQQEQQERMATLAHLPTIPTSSSDATNTEFMMKDVGVDEELHDPYQYLGDLKVEPRLTAGNGMPWNPYMTSNPSFPQTPAMLTSFPYGASYGHFGNALSPLMTPRLMPFFGYPQPILIPLPMYFAPTDSILYPSYAGSGNELDESIMSRAVGDQRAQSSHFESTPPHGSATPTTRNSQIYFMRFAPMPYMFMSGVGFTPTQQHTLPAIPSYTALPTISPILNIPLNFVANGKPTSIYQMGGAPNDFPNSAQFNNLNPFSIRPPASLTTGFSLPGANIPTSSSIGSSFSSHGTYGMSNPHSLQQDSKMTLLKRPFFFNGRPDEIYTLPNNFNPVYSNSGYY